MIRLATALAVQIERCKTWDELALTRAVVERALEDHKELLEWREWLIDAFTSKTTDLENRELYPDETL